MDLRLITPQDYPPQLREIPFMPPDLWLRGTLPPIDTKFLTVIGSRNLSEYGRRSCEELIAGLAEYPISIVSGLALGSDACAHKAALKAGLHTIAIPGSGLFDHVIGPRTNAPLAHEILAHGGALLSEQEPDHIPFPSDFPSRNRIMVGLADAVLLIEGGALSGTLISARLAADYNRELLCVPHRIEDENGYAS
ncbi:DNA-protecting protein DprA, partial [Patescibacteria group bacterium]|nr:DNA-protecting protein DprA [Patescibacteria group bacterium]MBU1754914.1 DNA-protecting protein DprA [Patescibacteria group bacterium]